MWRDRTAVVSGATVTATCPGGKRPVDVRRRRSCPGPVPSRLTNPATGGAAALAPPGTRHPITPHRPIAIVVPRCIRRPVGRGCTPYPAYGERERRGGSRVPDVFDEVHRRCRAGETVGVGHRGRDLALRAAPARRLDAGRARRRRPSAASPAAASRARSTSWPRRSSPPATPVLQRYGVSDDDAFAVGPDLRRHPRRLRRARSTRDAFPELGRGRRRHRRPARAGRRRHRASTAPGPDRLGPAAGASGRTGASGRSARSAATGSTTPSPTTPAGCSPPGAPAMLHLRPRRRAPRRGHAASS